MKMMDDHDGDEMMACFKPPPDSDMEGEEGEAMINWERMADGRVEITAVNGVSMGGPEKMHRMKEEPGAESGIDDLPSADGGGYG